MLYALLQSMGNRSFCNPCTICVLSLSLGQFWIYSLFPPILLQPDNWRKEWTNSKAAHRAYNLGVLATQSFVINLFNESRNWWIYTVRMSIHKISIKEQNSNSLFHVLFCAVIDYFISCLFLFRQNLGLVSFM